LVWRHGPGKQVEVCLVHRPRHGDWSLPKGKVRPGEHPLAAAVREVAEETGVRARPQQSLPGTRYRVGGAWKEVSYWAMLALAAPPFAAGSEVDRIAWLAPAEAAQRLCYPHDVALLHHWTQEPPVTAVVLLVRHAYAGERGDRPGPDHDRPLCGIGLSQADALCRLLRSCGPERLLSASPRRCVQTLAPLAEATGLPVEVAPAFDENGADPPAATAELLRAAASTGCTVICSQGAVIPPVLARLTGAADRDRWRTAKGDGWLVPLSGPVSLAPVRLAVGPPAGT
jgi:8-oxo-dGTP diphosphatase